MHTSEKRTDSERMGKTSRLPDLLAALNHDGAVATRSQIVHQYGSNAFRTGRARGHIVNVLPGIYAHSHHAKTVQTRVVATGRWLRENEAVSGLSACYLHGLVPRKLAEIAVVLPSSHSPRTPAWMSTRRLAAPIPIINVRGTPVAPLPHSLIHAWWDAGPREVTGLIIDAIRENLTSGSEILEALALFPRVKRRKKLLRLLEQLRDGIDSYLEHLADTTVLNTPDLRRLARQVRFVVAGKVYRVDAFDEETRTATEFDSRKYHNDDAARRRDIERDAALATIGIQTLRFTFEDVQDRPEWCRSVIQSTIAARRAVLLGRSAV